MDCIITCFSLISRSTRVQLIWLFLSHGIQVNSSDLEIVFEAYKFNGELDAILSVDMGIVSYHTPSLSPLIIYILATDTLTKEQLFETYPRYAGELLLYFTVSFVVMKNLGMAYLMTRPPVPSLRELARDATRVFIRKNCGANTTYKFYNELRKLDCPTLVKDIICFKRKVYNNRDIIDEMCGDGI